jgi:O-antigen/teichoic acid export membrane protein
MSILKKLAGQTMLYGLSSMVGRAINFLLVPFYTALLNPEAFGAITDIYAYAAFLNIIFLYGMETTYFRFANKDGLLNEEQVFNQAQTQLILSTLFLGLLMTLGLNVITSYTEYSHAPHYIGLMIAILVTDALLALPFARLRFANNASRFAFVKLYNIGLNVGFNILFLYLIPLWLKHNMLPSSIEVILNQWYLQIDLVSFIFISNLLANILQLPFLWISFKTFTFKWSKELSSKMWSYAWPLMIMGLAGMVNEMLDRVILKKLLPENFYPGQTAQYALGIYGACYKLSMFMTLMIQAFRYAAEPFFFSQSTEKNSKKMYAEVMQYFILACLVMYLFISVNLGWIKYFLSNEAYWEALYIVPILLMANLFLGVYYNLSIWFKLTDQTIWGTRLSIAGAVFTITANVLTIPLFGYLAAAWVTFFCYFFMAVASYYIGQKHFPIPYQMGKILLFLCTAVIIQLLIHWFAVHSILYYTLANATVVVWIIAAWTLQRKFFLKEV